jgi:CO/xanthine dehydrogenase Mo-binding subunit
MATTETKTTYIGAAVERKEDARLLRGDTRWVDNMTLPGMLWMAVVRSPYAHAKITKVDLSQALAADGVVAAFSGADLAEEWAGSLPCAWPVTGDCHIPQPARSQPTRRAMRVTALRSSWRRVARSPRTRPSSSRLTTSRFLR